MRRTLLLGVFAWSAAAFAQASAPVAPEQVFDAALSGLKPGI